MHRSPALLGITAAVAALAACGSSGPDTTPPSTTGPSPTAATTLSGLPFHYEALGESSGPTFLVNKSGSYTVAYILKGTAEQPGCTMSIAMVGQDGSVVPIVSGEKLNPTDTRQKSVPVTLKAGDWRFQEGGGCSWNVTVSAPA
jgi:predicted small lipoprotein YifL